MCGIREKGKEGAEGVGMRKTETKEVTEMR